MRHCSTLVLATALWATAPCALAQVPGVLPAPGRDVIANAASSAAAIAATEEPAAAAQALPTTQPLGPVAVPTRVSDPTAVRSLFANLGADLREAARPDNALILLGTGAGAALIHPYDFRLTDHFSKTPAFEHAFDAGQLLGGTLVQFGGSIATYAVGRIVKHDTVARVGADLVRAQLVNTVFTQGLKLSINRTRPDGDPWSFPSGHSSGTFATATVLQRHFGWKVGVPAYALAGYVAASRLQERRHFASDVIFGAGIGIVSGRVVTVGQGATRFAVAPMAVPGRGAGISFTRLAN